MNKEPFIQPRFAGSRFEKHTLPLSAARDLAAYEDLVLELAKHLFREKQPDRARLPKGFANNFSLHIESIDDGSAKPALVAMMLVGSQLSNSFPIEITEAKDLINTVIATPEGRPFPVEFPKGFYSYFNRIGRSLKEGEKIEWTPDLAEKTVLTSAKRIRLASAHRETYEAEADVVGLVEELDAKKKTGILRVQGNPVSFVFDDPFFIDLKNALGSSVINARVKGIGVFDANDRLGAIIEIDQLECIPHYGLVSKIDALASLADGWLEGNGIAPTSDNLNWFTNEVANNFPESLEYPSVAPSEEGHVILEWIRPKARIELEVNFSDQKLELYASNLTTHQFLEKSFNQSQWNEAFDEVERLLIS